MPRLPVDAARYAMYSSAMGAAEEEKTPEKWEDTRHHPECHLVKRKADS